MNFLHWNHKQNFFEFIFCYYYIFKSDLVCEGNYD